MNTPVSILIFAVIAAITLGSALAAVSLRQSVHCGLSVALTFFGAGLTHIFLGAEFVGFIQLLVYVGAVAVLIMFVILLTRPGADELSDQRVNPLRIITGAGTAILLFLLLASAILRSPSLATEAPAGVELPIATIGHKMVEDYLAPLFITGVLLTVAIVGGVPLAFGKQTK